MRFAKLGAQRLEASPVSKATCPACDGPVIAKCGRIRIWHWAHKAAACPANKEPETPWHREWKLQFPDAWQEVVQIGADGSRHIADICSSFGQVVEFQNSHIDLTEREAREAAYGKLIWVVNGTRLKQDKPSFFNHLITKKMVGHLRAVFEFNATVSTITRRWRNSNCVVYFDFFEPVLWRMNLEKVGWKSFLEPVQKSEFIRAILSGEEPNALGVWELDTVQWCPADIPV
jgi:competence protein CoiA